MKAQENEARAHAIAAEGYRLVLSAAGVVTEYERYELRQSLTYHQGRCAELVADEPEQPQAPQPDWSEAPDWASWWAVDGDGQAIWFANEPTPDKSGCDFWCVNPDIKNPRWKSAQMVNLDGGHWYRTLTARPQEAR